MAQRVRAKALTAAAAAAQAEVRRGLDLLAAAQRRQIEASDTAKTTEEARLLLFKISDVKRAEVSSRIEALVTKALRSVFGKQHYSFRFLWEEKRGTMTASPVIVTKNEDGEEITTDVVNGHGGGIVDVVAFVLRFVLLRLTPDLAPLMIVDEPFRHVASEHAAGLGHMLSLLSVKTGFRFLICTHQNKIAALADRIYRTEIDAHGATTLREETPAA